MKLNYFNFKKFNEKVLLTNDLGEYVFVSEPEFKNIICKKIDLNSELGCKLLKNNMIYDDTKLEFSSNRKYDLQYIKKHVNIATSLFIFVVTTACNMNCVYCQANSGKKCNPFYMTKEMAERAVDISLESPEKYISFEFQGGEPLLNFDIIKHIVLYAEAKKGEHVISYNVVTNLTLINDEMIDFFQKYCFGISTSVDGPEFVHNENRPLLSGEGTFEKVKDAVNLIRNKGLKVGAIQTTTRQSLEHPEELVRAYKDMGFESIFIRPLTPLGKASLNWDKIGYSTDEFLAFYIRAFEELIKINAEGTFLKEDHAAILLNKMQGEFVNYMELRSPCGAGIGQVAYYADGNIFTCDEGRMVYEMGDDTFCIGNVFTSKYSDIIKNSVCKTVCASSILESIPSCCDCVYQPYCGTCPVVNYASNNDVIEKQPRSYRCRIYSGMLDYLFSQLLKNDDKIINIITTWSN